MAASAAKQANESDADDAKNASANEPPADIDSSSPFSRSGTPRLQEQIPNAYFPDTLIVHDPHGVSMARDDRPYFNDFGWEAQGTDMTDDEEGKIFKARTARRTRQKLQTRLPRSDTSSRPAETKASGEQKAKQKSSRVSTEDDARSHRTAHLHMLPDHRIGVGLRLPPHTPHPRT
ncbi:hypothetical protein EUX98_g6056 [Antrodiella citrinella]|uniref:Uncharacterized protein n=1 Tax=Antrodiella citrinella TaxID=2447956 RepID=A0A4S4MQ36_9APHY|nr:hypothetical protein EUX98_g6056 [Antrodiella citrinella]